MHIGKFENTLVKIISFKKLKAEVSGPLKIARKPRAYFKRQPVYLFL
jgi:hypothetical protein